MVNPLMVSGSLQLSLLFLVRHEAPFDRVG